MKNPVLNFVYFTFNFPYGFISKAFQHDPILAKHYESKFSNYCEKNGSSAYAVLKLIVEMSEDNQKILIDWIAENYRNN